MARTKKNDTIITDQKEAEVLPKPKRGRKPKKIIEDQNQVQNISCVIQETTPENDIVDSNIEISNDNDNDDDNVASAQEIKDKPIGKKRGRKPKGGKIVQQSTVIAINKEIRPSVILHLKCSLKDLMHNTMNSSISSYNFSANNCDLLYEIVGEDDTMAQTNQSQNQNNEVDYYNQDETEYYDDIGTQKDNHKEGDTKEIWKKLKSLEHNLHINNVSDKKSACFWCTYDFDNPPVYIPKFYIKDTYHVYGCFCSPECATAHLMEENIDSSTKFERYYLINHIYSKIYDYKKNIKPAPNPYYMLDKFYGVLSIQEYRSLLRNERLFLIVDKPLTRIMPELHEDNDDFIINNKIIPSNTYQIKKKMQKRNLAKTSILNEKFGLNNASH